MSYDISVDEEKKIINVTWNGALEFSILKRYLLSYSYHMTHTNYHVLYDFRNVSDVVLNQDDLSQVADLAKQIFDPLLNNIKIAMLSTNREIAELVKLFISIREDRSEKPPEYNIFDDYNQAMNWLVANG